MMTLPVQKKLNINFYPKSIEELKILTFLDANQFPSDVVKQEIAKNDIEWINYKHISNNKIRAIYLYSLLTLEQKQIFKLWHKYANIVQCDDFNNDCGSQCLSLNAKPGTGKSFLCSIFTATCRVPVYYIAYSNNLVNQIAGILNVDPINLCSFLMTIAKLSYYKAKQLCSMTSKMIDDFLLALNNVSKNIEHKIILIDEYTVIYAPIIALLYGIAKKINALIIYIGDPCQLPPIRNSKWHLSGNYEVITLLAVEKFKLNKILRYSSLDYAEKLLRIASIIENNNFYAKNNFGTKYLLYQLFPDKFTTKSILNSIFLSQNHKTITQHLSNHLCNNYNVPQWLQQFSHTTKSTETYVYSMYRRKANKKLFPLKFVSKFTKFLNHLPLVKKLPYIYVDKLKCKHIVTLFDIDIPNDKIVILCNDELKFLSPQTISSYLPSENLRFLKELVTGNLYNFPIYPYYSTYHAVQGMTISDYNLEIDIDCMCVNSIYVGLSRISSPAQLTKIHTSDLPHLICTNYFNDEYYYRVKNFSQWQQSKESIIFAIVDSYEKFISSFNTKILKSSCQMAETANNEISHLISFCQLLKQTIDPVELNKFKNSLMDI